MYRVLITGNIHASGVKLLTSEPDLEVDFRPDLPMDEIMKIVGGYHALITRSETPVTRELIDAAKELKVIARAAVGYANIDVDYATEKGILVMNTPGKNTNSAAELAFSLLLDIVRKVVKAHETMEKGGWDRHRFQGMELMDKTIGIIGLGNVGHRMARFARGFDMRVLAYDPYVTDEVFERNRAEKCDWNTLITESDVITVHVPKNKETINMIDADTIACMKEGVVLINAARGGIVNEQALLDALKSGHVAGAGIDTWDKEPPQTNPFAELERVVMTPHIGASTEEAQVRVARTIGEQVPRALRGGIVDYPVNMPQIRVLEGDVMTSYAVLCEKLGSFAAQFLDFDPQRLEIVYRGTIAKQDCTILRLAFLKGYLKHSQEHVSYVNAEQRALKSGLKITNTEDPGFTDYESAVRFIFTEGEHRFHIGGVVFSGPHPRITLIDGFPFEIDPAGSFLAIRSLDRLGVISNISSIMDEHKITIKSFSYSHNDERKRSMFLIRTGTPASDDVINDLLDKKHITMAKRISI